MMARGVRNIYDTTVYDIPSKETGEKVGTLEAGAVREVRMEGFNGWLLVAEGWIRPIRLAWVALMGVST